MGRHKKREQWTQKHLRLPSSLDSQIEAEAKRQGFPSYNEFLNELLEKGLKKAVVTARETMVKINAKFEGKCVQCEKSIKISQSCWWAREVGIMCEDCHQEIELEGIGDVTLARLYARKRKLKKTCQGLKKIADELADRVNQNAQKINLYRLGEIHEQIEKHKREILNIVDDFLRKQMGTEGENDFLKKSLDFYGKLEEWQEELRKKIKEDLIVPLKKKQQKKQTCIE